MALTQKKKKTINLEMMFNKSSSTTAKVTSTTTWANVHKHVRNKNYWLRSLYYNEQKIRCTQMVGDVLPMKDLENNSRIKIHGVESTMIKTFVFVRENTDWNTWTKVLKQRSGKTPKSQHKWKLNINTTFGEIRTKVAKYYHMNAFNIEIWLQTQTKSKQRLHWLYNFSASRPSWDQTLKDVMYKSMSLDSKYLYIKFEFVVYNVNNFDRMIRYYANETIQSPEDEWISKLARYKLSIYAPNQKGMDVNPSCIPTMTILYNKHWKAKQLISKILQYLLYNQVFGTVYFAFILKYFASINNDPKLSIRRLLSTLTPKQFVLCVDTKDKVPVTYRMNQIYTFPRKFRGQSVTDIRLQCLSPHDPFVQPSLYKPLWIHFQSKHKTSKVCYRMLIHEEDTFEDMISNQISQYLYTNNQNNAPLSFDHIINTYRFELSGYPKPLTQLKDKMCDIMNTKSRLNIQLLETEKVTSCILWTETQLNLSKIQYIASDCHAFGYSFTQIASKYDIETIANAMQWIHSHIIYCIGTRQFQIVFSRLLLGRLAIGFYVYNMSFLDGDGDDTRGQIMNNISTKLHTLHHIVSIDENGSSIDYAVRVGWAACASCLCFAQGHDCGSIQSILQFQIWLLKHQYQSGIGLGSPTLDPFCLPYIIGNTPMERNQIKYILQKLWDLFDHVVTVTIDGEDLMWLLKPIQHCYTVLQMDMNDISIEFQRRIYQMNDQILQTRLMIVLDLILSEIQEAQRKTPEQCEDLNGRIDAQDCVLRGVFEEESEMFVLKYTVRGLQCAWCSRKDKRLKRCDQCNQAWYCCRIHQKLHWDTHRVKHVFHFENKY
eukprot:238531_1